MIAIITIAVCLVSLSSACPSADLISPCYCYDRTLVCGYELTEQKQLDKVFDTLSKELSKEEKSMGEFYLQSTGVQELTANIFRDITFERIEIMFNTKLTKINANAFITTASVTKVFVIQADTSLEQQGRNDGLYSALGKLVNAEEITIWKGTNITTIPTYSFPPANGFQTKLKKLFIEDIGYRYSPLSQLESRAFWYLSWLDTLTLSRTAIQHIPEYAFELENGSNSTWTIDLGNHYGMDGSAFGANSLSKINRPVTLILPGSRVQHSGPIDFKYLYEKAFLPFFRDNDENRIDYSVYLNCNDCRNIWIKSYPQFIKRIPGIQCFAQNANGNNDFNDPSNFAHC